MGFKIRKIGGTTFMVMVEYHTIPVCLKTNVRTRKEQAKIR
jgi:hypothetical protein